MRRSSHHIINHNTHNFMKTIKTILFIAFMVLAIDFFGMIGWAMSGQRPVDGFYVGAISTNIAREIFVDEKVPCSFPDPQFSGAEPEDYNATDCEIDFIQGGEIK